MNSVDLLAQFEDLFEDFVVIICLLVLSFKILYIHKFFFDSYNTACHEIAFSFFIEVQLIYSTLPIYAIQQNDSV